MPYAIGRMIRRRGGLGRGLPGVFCPCRLPLMRGPVGLAFSVLAGWALNDLAAPQGRLRSLARRMLLAHSSMRVIGYEAAGEKQTEEKIRP